LGAVVVLLPEVAGELASAGLIGFAGDSCDRRQVDTHHPGAYDVAMKKKQPQVRKVAEKPEPQQRAWHVGDRVTKQGMIGPYEITPRLP
jgi:hypothetical protein